MTHSTAEDIKHYDRFMVKNTHVGFGHKISKRAIDVVFVLLALPIFLPIVLIVYLIVKLDGGPGFFGHERLGRNGKPFKVWKIRTMVPDADNALKAHLHNNPAAAKEWSNGFKLSCDPRITRVGNILRETSLDELPQLWNVFKGEMSLVGPRPIVAPELEKYAGQEWVYLSNKPGITGLWQVSGRNDVDYRTRVKLDTTYATTQSLYYDFLILIRTVGAVLGRTGR